MFAEIAAELRQHGEIARAKTGIERARRALVDESVELFEKRRAVGLRIVHSIWQATVNKVPVRFMLFLAGSLVLVFLAYRALSLTLFHDPGLAPA